MLCCKQEKKLSDLGLDGLLIVLYLLANWHYVHKVWIFFLLNYWRSISQRNCRGIFDLFDLSFEDKF